MLEYAKKHEDRLRQLFYDTAFDLYYKFDQLKPYRETFKLPEDNWDSTYFVSIHNDEIVGVIGYHIERLANLITGLYAIHFGGEAAHNSYVFGKDLLTAIKDIFEKYGFNKINFKVVIGNPIEKTYDEWVKKYNGRIVGIKRQEVRLMDNKLYDLKEYEILASDYFQQGRKN